MNDCTSRRPPTPAFTKQASTRPSVATVSANARSTAASSPTSHTSVCTRPPCDRSRSAAAAFFSAFVPHTQTAAPAAANPSAIPRPIPLLPPVISATLSLRSNAR